MMIRGTAAMLFIGGVMLWLMAKIIPLLTFMMMDMVGIFMMCGAMFMIFFCFSISGTGLQYDTIPPGTAVINYIRRDGIIAPQLGKRIFSGESFLDVPRLGLIEDLGTDTVLLWGRKKVRFGLENINYTPDPRYWNMTRELYNLGFDDTEDLYNIMNIPYMDNEKDKAKKVYYLERMGQIYWAMKHNEPHGGERLVESFRRRPKKRTSFGPKRGILSGLKEEHDRNKKLRAGARREAFTQVETGETPSEAVPKKETPSTVGLTVDEKRQLIKELLKEK